MEKPTLFDLVCGNLLWQCDFCSFCDRALPDIRKVDDVEIVMRVYQGQHGHLCMIGYHKGCYIEHERAWADLRIDM